MALFQSLGFNWERNVLPKHSTLSEIERVCFHFQRSLAELVWDAGVLEGNPFTFAEVKTLLDGVTVGGRKLSDQEQILNLAESAKRLLAMVRSGRFILNKSIFCELHALIARNEALEWGDFRGEGKETHYTPPVGLGEQGRYIPPLTEASGQNLNQIFAEGVNVLNNEIESPLERALSFFLFGALQQFFFNGNKRTSRFMMNGVLLSQGIDAISIPAARVQDFNEKMIRFYLSKDATEMMEFLLYCYKPTSKTEW